MVRYHEGGRFCDRDEEWDRESAVFHLEHAADLGELEAIVGLGLMYSQLPHHILAEVSLEVREQCAPRRNQAIVEGSTILRLPSLKVIHLPPFPHPHCTFAQGPCSSVYLQV